MSRLLPRLSDPSGLHPLFVLSLRIRLGAYGKRYGAPMRQVANLLDRVSRSRLCPKHSWKCPGPHARVGGCPGR